MIKSLLICVGFLLVGLPVLGQAAGAKTTLDVRVVLVGADRTEALRNVIALAEVKLSQVPGVQLLERQAIDRVLAEQKLNLSGLVATDQVLKLGKLLSVQLFVILEAGADQKRAGGLVIFDAGTGVRLWDAALPPGGQEATVTGVVEAVQAARQKRQSVGNLRTVCLLTVRNADLPKSMDGLCDAVGQLMERQLISSTRLALLERRRLEQVNQERNLPLDSPLRPLLASVVTLELEIGRNTEGKGLKATTLLSDSQGKSLGQRTATIATRDVKALAHALAQEVAQVLKTEVAATPPNRAQEAFRFLREAEFWWGHKDFHRSLTLAESAYALQPENSTMRGAVAFSLVSEAMQLVDTREWDGHGRQPFLEEADPVKLVQGLELALRSSELLIEGDPEDSAVCTFPPRTRLRDAEEVFNRFSTTCRYLRRGATPEARKLFTAIRVNRQRQHEILINRMAATVRDGDSFSRLSREVDQSTLEDSFQGLSPEQQGRILVRLRPLAELAGKYDDVQAHSSRGALNYALLTYYPVPRAPNATELARQEQFAAELARNPNPIVADYGRIVGLYAVLWYGNLSDTERRQRVRDFRLSLQARLEKTDKEADERRGDLYWLALRGIQSLQYYPGFKEEIKELCAFMFSHQELEKDVALEMVGDLRTLHTPEGYRTADQMASRAMAIAASPTSRVLYPDKRFRPAKPSPGKESVSQDFWREKQLIRQEYPELGSFSAAGAPWSRAETLIDLYPNREGLLWIQKPVPDGGVVCLAALRREGTPPQNSVQLLRLTPGGGRWEGRRVPISLPDEPWGEQEGERIRLLPKFGMTAFVHDHHYYLGTRQGLFIFPFDDRPPEHITGANGLPSDCVQRMALLGNKLYAYLGEPAKDCYIVSWDLKTRKCEVLASSRRKNKISPFDDHTALACSVMLANPARSQILFSAYHVGINKVPELDGLWALDIWTNKFEHLLFLQCLEVPILLHELNKVEGDRFIMGNWSYDLAKNDHHLTNKFFKKMDPVNLSPGRFPTFITGFNAIRPPFLLVHNHRLVADEWSSHMKSLRSQDKNFEPRECIQIFRNEDEVLIGDSCGLWLVTIPEKKN